MCTIVNVQDNLSNIGQKDRINCISEVFYMCQSNGDFIFQAMKSSNYSHGQIRVDTLIFYYILSINPSSFYCL